MNRTPGYTLDVQRTVNHILNVKESGLRYLCKTDDAEETSTHEGISVPVYRVKSLLIKVVDFNRKNIPVSNRAILDPNGSGFRAYRGYFLLYLEQKQRQVESFLPLADVKIKVDRDVFRLYRDMLRYQLGLSLTFKELAKDDDIIGWIERFGDLPLRSLAYFSGYKISPTSHRDILVTDIESIGTFWDLEQESLLQRIDKYKKAMMELDSIENRGINEDR